MDPVDLLGSHSCTPKKRLEPSMNPCLIQAMEKSKSAEKPIFLYKKTCHYILETIFSILPNLHNRDTEATGAIRFTTPPSTLEGFSENLPHRMVSSLAEWMPDAPSPWSPYC